MKRILLFLLAAPALLYAQEFVFQPEYDSVRVQMNGWDLFCPWVGGFTETAPDFCDIDDDGDLDLFLGQYINSVPFFRNTGTALDPDFSPEPHLSDSMRSVDIVGGGGRTNPDFFDLDGDDDFDVLIGSGYVTILLNQGTPALSNFLTSPDTVFDTSGDPVFGTHVTLCDIDDDGDGDLICGEYQGHLQFYRNVGTPDSFAFYLEDDHWLGVDVGTQADPTFCDIDGNGTMDLFIGDDLGQIYFYRNIGTPRNCRFTLVSGFYANIDVGDKAAPEFADIDNDGDYDLFVGVEYNGDMRFYENIGTPRRARFEFKT
ncbi:MAG TPA: VCBS repeat-containing protein [bacterium]|jgi:hypothetical protein